MAVTEGKFITAREKALKKYFVNEYEMTPPMRKIVFGEFSSKADHERFSSAGSFAKWGAFTGTIGFQDISEGYTIDIYFDEKASGFQVTRKMKDDDQVRLVASLPRALAEAGARTIEEDHADVFNDGFTSVPAHNSEGNPLFYSAHPSFSDASFTQSNAGTTALSATELDTIRLIMRNWKDDRRNKIVMNPDTVIIPIEMEKQMFEINGSSQMVDTNYNNVNFFKGKFRIIVWNYLDNDKWFLVDSQKMKKYLLSCERVPVEFFKDSNSTNLIEYYVGYMRYGMGWLNWRFAYGENT